MVSRRQLITGATTGVLVGVGASTAQAQPLDDIRWLLDEFALAGRMSPTTPSDEQLLRLPAYAQLALLRRRKVSAQELAELHLARIAAVDDRIGAFVHIAHSKALAAAKESDRRYKKGTHRLLEGLPSAVKDLFDFWEGVPNTFGSRPMKDFVAPGNATYVQRMLDAGLVLLGKTKTPEFGHKGTTDNLLQGPTGTPFDLRFNAGGSSGGAAAALASSMVALTQGSDAGGSVRIPAAMCGIVGMYPSVGRWPQSAPPIASAPFFTAGPMARSVADIALLMQAVSGPHDDDPLSLDGQPNYMGALRRGMQGKKPLQGMRIAYSPDMDLFPVESAVERVVRSALAGFQEAGAVVDKVHLGLDKIMVTEVGGKSRQPLTSHRFADDWVRMQAGLYGHARDLFLEFGVPVDLREHQDQLTSEFWAMLELSRTMSAEQYRHLDFLRANVLHTLNAVLRRYDFIVTPTLATAGVSNATGGNTLGPTSINGVKVNPQIGWCLTYPLNFSGHPAISVPAGLVESPLGTSAPKLPVGLQLVGPMRGDAAVIMAAAAFEQQRPWVGHYPR